MHKQPVVVVDAFTTVPFRGNPAAVCLMDIFPEDAMLQNIAAEMHLSETAFLVRRGARSYELRWFTPESEVDLCGHATLAAAHMLLETGPVRQGDAITFSTRSGEVGARFGELIELDFPLLPGTHRPVSDSLKRCLGVPIRAAEHNDTYYLAEVESLDHLRDCRPNMDAIALLDAEGLIVTTAAGCGGYDFASRCFCPRMGIPEDPVTGSSHCMLAPYWAAALGRAKFRAFQASARGGELRLQIEGDRVFIGGHAVTVMRGVIELKESYALEHAA